MNNLLILFGIVVLNVIISIIMNFLAIKTETYVNYLMWFDLLFVFYLVLPNRVGRIF